MRCATRAYIWRSQGGDDVLANNHKEKFHANLSTLADPKDASALRSSYRRDHFKRNAGWSTSRPLVLCYFPAVFLHFITFLKDLFLSFPFPHSPHRSSIYLQTIQLHTFSRVRHKVFPVQLLHTRNVLFVVRAEWDLNGNSIISGHDAWRAYKSKEGPTTVELTLDLQWWSS